MYKHYAITYFKSVTIRGCDLLQGYMGYLGGFTAFLTIPTALSDDLSHAPR